MSQSQDVSTTQEQQRKQKFYVQGTYRENKWYDNDIFVSYFS
jgi:hypothetical protein